MHLSFCFKWMLNICCTLFLEFRATASYSFTIFTKLILIARPTMPVFGILNVLEMLIRHSGTRQDLFWYAVWLSSYFLGEKIPSKFIRADISQNLPFRCFKVNSLLGRRNRVPIEKEHCQFKKVSFLFVFVLSHHTLHNMLVQSI